MSMRSSVVVIGAGQAGLAMSYCLDELGIDHVVLERGEVANSWRKERWDSLRLLTPNWQSRLPGHRYQGSDPDGFMSMAEVVDFVAGYARTFPAPVRTHCRVTRVSRTDDGYRVETSRGEWRCRAVVLASGASNLPVVPAVSQGLPRGVASFTPMDYRNPGDLPEGGVLVVGASATGVQLAQEIHASGRPVTLSVGEHVRMPRLYRGRDVQWWMDAAGVLDESYTEVDDLARARGVPSPQLVGTPQRSNLDLNTLTDAGVEVVGRLAGMRDGRALFSGSLPNLAALADLKMGRLLERFDQWARTADADVPSEAPEEWEPTRVPDTPRLSLDLESGAIRSVLWATGFRPDYSWLDVPVLDRKGKLRHDGGVVDAPGLYALGLTFLRKRKSSFIHGVEDDVRFLSRHLAAHLGGAEHAPRRAAVA
ncbi:MAG TPA: NAD(P)-binding domain-containing protein [Thermoanaerobaculia bacterium]|nr:NAD(P)-binding domain-containing protein [Thermoanaerobaculia bacterium]